MSPSVRRIWLALLTIIVAIIVLRSLVKTDEHARGESHGYGNKPSLSPNDTEKRHISSATRTRHAVTGAVSSVSRTSGVTSIASTPPSLTPPVSGFIVDQFRRWKTIPPGYVADGIILRDGAITLSDATDTSGPRDGILISPPLPLRQPAMAGPVRQSITLPDGSAVQLQVSLSEDGETWSPWLMVQHYAPPDGKRIAPKTQPMLANADLALLDSQSFSSEAGQNLPGPKIRYRLGLSASGVAPAVSDLRIWTREAP